MPQPTCLCCLRRSAALRPCIESRWPTRHLWPSFPPVVCPLTLLHPRMLRRTATRFPNASTKLCARQCGHPLVAHHVQRGECNSRVRRFVSTIQEEVWPLVQQPVCGAELSLRTSPVAAGHALYAAWPHEPVRRRSSRRTHGAMAFIKSVYVSMPIITLLPGVIELIWLPKEHHSRFWGACRTTFVADMWNIIPSGLMMYLAHGDDGFGSLTRRDPGLGWREAGELLLLLCSHDFWFYITHRMNHLEFFY
eukprot:scaffold22731_cov64-Phaeocystis_antarctica.AAC.4